MSKVPEEKLDLMIKRLDIIAIFLLAQKGLSQKEIAKILSVDNNKIREIFGKTYSKISDQ